MEKQYSPWNQPPMKSTTQIHYQTSKGLFQVGHAEGGEQIRCESKWEEEASKTDVVLRTFSSCVFLMVGCCLLQISVCLANGDGWTRQSPDTPLMSHSSHSKQALSPCTATGWRVMDGLCLRYMQERFSPWLIIKEDSYKTENTYCVSNTFISQKLHLSTSRQLAPSLMSVCLPLYFAHSFHIFSIFVWSLSERCFFLPLLR